MAQPHPTHPLRKRIFRLIEFVLTSLILLLYFSYPFVYAYKSTRPAPSGLGDYAPSNFGAPYEDVTLTATDGAPLSGWYIPSRSGAAVILLHGYDSSRINMFVHAEILYRHGFGVLLYDERASGLSGGAHRSYGWQDREDVAAALDYLRSRPEVDPGRIGIGGISTGAEIALGAASQYADLRAVLADGAGFSVQQDIPPAQTFGEWTLKPITPLMFGALERFSGVHAPRPLSECITGWGQRPLFLISTGSAMEKRQAELYFNLAGEPKTHWNLPDSKHGMAVFTDRAEYEQRMTAFFEQALLGKK